MDRLSARIFLLLVTGALVSNTFQNEQLDVHLEPKSIKVCEGESVTMNCTFQPGGKYKVKWYYSQTPNLGCNSATDRTRKMLLISTGNNATWSTFNITSIKTNDSGWYFCKVTRDIPYLLENCSDGIEVLVDANITTDQNATGNPTQKQTQNSTTEESTTCRTSATTSPVTLSLPPSYGQWWIWLAMAVGCIVLVVSIVVIFIVTRKTTEIIYENTKPVESGCCRRNRNQMDNCNLSESKKNETIKPLRKYDTLSSNRNRRP